MRHELLRRQRECVSEVVAIVERGKDDGSRRPVAMMKLVLRARFPAVALISLVLTAAFLLAVGHEAG